MVARCDLNIVWSPGVTLMVARRDLLLLLLHYYYYNYNCNYNYNYYYYDYYYQYLLLLHDGETFGFTRSVIHLLQLACCTTTTSKTVSH